MRCPKVSTIGSALFGGKGKGMSRNPRIEFGAGGVHVHEDPGDEVVDERIALGVDLHRVELGDGGGKVRGLAEGSTTSIPAGPSTVISSRTLARARNAFQTSTEISCPRRSRPGRPAGENVDVVEDGQVPAGPGEARRTRRRPAGGRPGIEQRLEREGATIEASSRGPGARPPGAGWSRPGPRAARAARGRGCRLPRQAAFRTAKLGRACSRARRPGGSPAGRSPRPPPRTRTRSGGSRPGPTARRDR